MTRAAPLLDMVIGDLVLALLDQSVELVGEGVDGFVHVARFSDGVDVPAADLEGGLRLVAQLLDRQHV